MAFKNLAALLVSVLPVLNALSIAPRSNGAATVDLSKSLGPAQQIASGWIYGFPDNGVQADTSIPAHFSTDVKFRAGRAGGAQIPAKGWVGGLDGYIPRMNSTISNYRTTREYGGEFFVLVHDIWGADGSNIPLFPGDNGDWTETDKFLQQLVNDFKSNDMLEGLIIDIWNEPDLDLFWKRSWDQFLAYYVHATDFFRKELPGTLLSGPAMSVNTLAASDKWDQWFSTIAEQQAIPDVYSWHQIDLNWGGPPDKSIPAFNTEKAAKNLPDRPIHITEYATPGEQTPTCSVFYIAQLERHNLYGLRANWASGYGLHDDLANLVFKDGSGSYQPNGEWLLYKYYAEMSGDRVSTAASDDLNFDVFATKTSSGAKIIAGSRNLQSPYDIKVSGLADIGVTNGGKVKVQTYQFNWNGAGATVTGPEDLGVKTIDSSDGSIVLTVNPPTSATAYAYEIVAA